MISDNFEQSVDSVIAPARNCFPVIPSDAEELAQLPKAIYIGTGGNLVVRPVDGNADVTFVNLPNGATLDIRIVAVRATGTTAGDLVGLA